MAKKQNNNELGETRVRRARLEFFTIYEVTEGELNSLERGTNSDLYLQFSIFCLSVFVSFFISLLSGTFIDRIVNIFVCITFVSFIIGVLLLFLWYRTRKRKKDVINDIRNRLKDNQTSEEGTTRSIQ